MFGPGIKPDKALELKKYLLAGEFPPDVDEQSKKLSEQAFKKIDCLSCANCCKSSPPLIEHEDISRISKHLGISRKQFKRKYVLEDINGDLSFMSVPCVFLEEDNSCSIYEIRPKACRRYPHMDESKFYKLRRVHSKNVLTCPIAYEVVKQIKKSSEAN